VSECAGSRCYGHEADPLLLEDFDDPGKVQQGPAQPVHLVNHDTIDFAGADERIRVLPTAEVDAVVQECAQTPLDKTFLDKAYNDIAEYRKEQARKG
jgi:hypothetical protein